MINILDEDKRFLEQHLPNVEENLQSLLDSDDIDDLLIATNCLILYDGFDKDGYYNNFGLKVQEIYDRLYDMN